MLPHRQPCSMTGVSRSFTITPAVARFRCQLLYKSSPNNPISFHNECLKPAYIILKWQHCYNQYRDGWHICKILPNLQAKRGALFRSEAATCPDAAGLHHLPLPGWAIDIATSLLGVRFTRVPTLSLPLPSCCHSYHPTNSNRFASTSPCSKSAHPSEVMDLN